LQNHSRNFWWAILFALDLDPGVTIIRTNNFKRHYTLVAVYFGIIILATHKAFNGVNRIFRIRDRLAFSYLTNKTLTTLVDSHD